MGKQEHRPLVVSGPSGSGKSTLLNRLFADYPETFGFSVSHTTRAPRAGEENGKQYHFVSRTDFQKMIDDGSFIEHAEFSGNLYGTSVEAVKKVADEGKIAVLDVDMQGVKSVKKTDLNARCLFIRPPSLEVLEQRLRGRNTETEEAVTARLEIAKAELAFADEPGSHDFVIVNDDLEEAYKKLKDYVADITGTNPMVNSETPDPAAKEAQVVAASATHLGMTPIQPIPEGPKKSTEKLAGDNKAPAEPVTTPEAGASGDAAPTAAAPAASAHAGAPAAAASTSTAPATTAEAQGKADKGKKKEKEKQKSKSCLIL